VGRQRFGSGCAELAGTAAVRADGDGRPVVGRGRGDAGRTTAVASSGCSSAEPGSGTVSAAGSSVDEVATAVADSVDEPDPGAAGFAGRSVGGPAEPAEGAAADPGVEPVELAAGAAPVEGPAVSEEPAVPAVGEEPARPTMGPAGLEAPPAAELVGAAEVVAAE
jgi:hypothetical protein